MKIDGLLVDIDCLAEGSLIAGKLGLPMWYDRGEVKDHGTCDRIEGALEVLKKCENVLRVSRWDA